MFVNVGGALIKAAPLVPSGAMRKAGLIRHIEDDAPGLDKPTDGADLLPLVSVPWPHLRGLDHSDLHNLCICYLSPPQPLKHIHLASPANIP